jgi:hypothetical protein
VFRGIGAAVIERQHGVGSPDGNASLECPYLAVGKLARIALLQFVED